MRWRKKIRERTHKQRKTKHRICLTVLLLAVMFAFLLVLMLALDLLFAGHACVPRDLNRRRVDDMCTSVAVVIDKARRPLWLDALARELKHDVVKHHGAVGAVLVAVADLLLHDVHDRKVLVSLNRNDTRHRLTSGNISLCQRVRVRRLVVDDGTMQNVARINIDLVAIIVVNRRPLEILAIREPSRITIGGVDRLQEIHVVG